MLLTNERLTCLHFVLVFIAAETFFKNALIF